MILRCSQGRIAKKTAYNLFTLLLVEYPPYPASSLALHEAIVVWIPDWFFGISGTLNHSGLNSRLP